MSNPRNGKLGMINEDDDDNDDDDDEAENKSILSCIKIWLQ